jgi:hypothetical protein
MRGLVMVGIWSVTCPWTVAMAALKSVRCGLVQSGAGWSCLAHGRSERGAVVSGVSPYSPRTTAFSCTCQLSPSGPIVHPQKICIPLMRSGPHADLDHEGTV